jgi:hypothetical protein
MKSLKLIQFGAALASLIVAFGIALGGPPPQEDPHPGLVAALNCPPPTIVGRVVPDATDPGPGGC